MSIFSNFNNQGLDNDAAFEEMCCQLFETWGARTMQFDSNWEYLDIRGSGGDGGIEAFWHNVENDRYIGIQAKWFAKTITKSQYKQLRDSIETAMKLRPTLTQYIVCIPHNLTSLRSTKGDTVSLGEESTWKTFRDGIAQTYTSLEILLWDEHYIGNLLQEPANEGRWRFWFERSAVNPDLFRLALAETIEGLKNRYIPEMTDNGELAIFLDNFFGTTKSRSLTIKEIDATLAVCHDLAYVADSFTKVGDGLPKEIKSSAARCHDAVCAYSDALSKWRHMLTAEPYNLVAIDSIVVEYEAIENFEHAVRNLREKRKLTRHTDELIKLIEKFRELPGEYKIYRRMHDSFSHPHCVVVGEQGTGKTCGFANKASEFMNSGQHLPIFICAAGVDDQSGWREVISNALGLSHWNEAELWQALSSSAALLDKQESGISSRAKVAVFVDGLDEKGPPSRWTTLIRQSVAITKEYPRIRFAYSSRPYGIERTHTDGLWECSYRIEDEGDVPACELFDRYIEHYNINLAGSTRYKWMLQTPMELHMFCTAYSGKRIDKEVSTCLTSLVNAETDRLEEEYAARNARAATGLHKSPIRSALIALATEFIADDAPRDRAVICDIIENGCIQHEDVGDIIDFLETHGILATIRQPGATSLSPFIFKYQPGSRHLWDYFMAVVLTETEDAEAADTLLRHGDAAYLYAVLLIEKRGILPIENNGLVDVLGNERVRQLTIDALACANKDIAGKFRQWVFSEMNKDKESLSEIINSIIVQVAEDQEHPLGSAMFDEYMRTFRTPIERDAVWSIPTRSLYSDRYLSFYFERDAVKDLPCLHEDSTWNQMPLLLAWCLTSVSNLRRKHCRNELVLWAVQNPAEYLKLFNHLNDCDDPQMREDLFAIAEEIVCQGETNESLRMRFAKIAYESVFASPDKPGNRDAALRYYGRMLIEKCGTDGIVDSSIVNSCKPPYKANTQSDVLPIYPAAAGANRMSGFEAIHYDLARYVLVDKLESAFGFTYFHTNGERYLTHTQPLAEKSAFEAGIKTPTFEGWVIAAAYQYLINHGYDPDLFVGPIGDNEHRLHGIDRKISNAFGHADHGAQSTVMTVAEKYVWCARNEICGYMADRVPAYKNAWQNDTEGKTCELVRDYSALLDYQSPLFEASVNRAITARAGTIPAFPAEFSCDDDTALCPEKELNDWIISGSANALTALLNYAPNTGISLDGNVTPIAIYASDWSICGKQAQGWAYCGVMKHDEFEKLSESGTVAIDGYDYASAFTASIDAEATYISPVEYMSAPWINDCQNGHERNKTAEVYVAATPLSGSGVDSLTDIGDYWYHFPSKLARDLCGANRTDGVRYFNSDGETIFEDIDYGEPYRKRYQALLADKDKLFDAVKSKNLQLVWYATLQRGGNELANERLQQVKRRFERSWLIWVDTNGEYLSCRISDEYPAPEHICNPLDFIKEPQNKRSSNTDEIEDPSK